jgi:hypothetical protein
MASVYTYCLLTSSDDASVKSAEQTTPTVVDTAAAKAEANNFPFAFEKVADNTWVI